jgi:ATP-dependent DNA helicase RecQ
MPDLHHSLQHHFGHATFRAGQQQVMEALLAGRSALAIFPTGAGKSLCYQLPALLLPGLTLVISPLIALMKDQVEALQAKGVAAARLDSTLTASEVAAVFNAMHDRSLKLLYVAPERLMNENFLRHLERTEISLLAIDESHCISEWGHNFRPDYLRLAKVARQLDLRPVLALTATATPSVAADIRKTFEIDPQDHVQTPFHRANLQLVITPVSAAQRLSCLTQKLVSQRLFPAIVYVTLQETAEHVATALQRSGLDAAAYHAGLPDERRASVQERFMGGDLQVIVATIAFGMGIDKADIRAVYHFNLPKSLENYQQEIGRAGRDGRPSHCELLACGDDLTVLQNFVFGDTPTPAALRQLLNHLLRQGETFDISHYELSRTVDIRPLVLETVLTYLEMEGVLTPLGPYYVGHQFRLLQPEQRILSGHKPARQELLARLFQAGKRGSKWITFANTETIAETLGEPRERVLSALQWLHEAGEIELKPSGLRHRYQLCAEPSKREPNRVATRMEDLFALREKNDTARLNLVLDYAAEPGCLTRYLLHYFGEDLGQDCGHCGSCAQPSAQRREIPLSHVPSLMAADIALIHDLHAERHAALRAPRQLARFLCGLTSPATTRDRLTRHDAFGALRQHPFLQVLTQCESLIT